MNRLRYILISLAATAAMAAMAQHSAVINPEIPAKVSFAGKTVSLDRDDMYYLFDHALTSMIYTHGNTLLTIKRANRYFPAMAPILKRHGVPSDLLYLACIESYLNPRARSGAGAAGVWQFMPATAKEYGLEVNNYVDERYNLEKATDAACRFLKRAYSRFGNWESVAASYNGGMARISRELEAQGQNTAYDLYLTDETWRYMFRLLAMKLIMTRPDAYGFELTADQLYRPAECTAVKVSEPVDDWQQWAAAHGTTYMALREYNPWIRAKSLPNKSGKTYTVMVPKPGAQLRSRQKPTVYDRNWIKE